MVSLVMIVIVMVVDILSKDIMNHSTMVKGRDAMKVVYGVVTGGKVHWDR